MLRAINKSQSLRNSIIFLNKQTVKCDTRNCERLFGTTAKVFNEQEQPQEKRNLEPPKGNPFQQKKEKVGGFGWVLLAIPITTFALGTWQIQRKKWKEELIKKVEKQFYQEPVELPEDLNELNQMEYRPVRLRGEYLHNKELYIGPRPLRNKDDDNSSGLISQSTSIGFQIVTPFKLENSDHIILVNRGWVPKEKLHRDTRAEGQQEGIVELVGIVRKADRRPPFAPKGSGERHALTRVPETVSEQQDNDITETFDNSSDIDEKKDKCKRKRKRFTWGKEYFMFRDIPRMCALTGSEPFFVDATVESTIPGGPIGGQTNVTLRNEHSSYIITWYSLSALTSYLWYKRIFKRM